MRLDSVNAHRYEMERPAWRKKQTGARSTGLPRQARTKRRCRKENLLRDHGEGVQPGFDEVGPPRDGQFRGPQSEGAV